MAIKVFDIIGAELRPSRQQALGEYNYWGQVNFHQELDEDTGVSKVTYYFYIWTTYNESKYNIETGLDGDHNQVYDTVGGVNGIYTSNYGRISLIGRGASNKYLVDSGTRNVTHNSDGTASISYSCRYISPARDASGSLGVWGDLTISGTQELNAMEGGCTLNSVPNVTIGNSHTVTWNNASEYPDAHIKLEWMVGSIVRYTQHANASSGSASYTIPKTWANDFPTSQSFSITVRATTYSSYSSGKYSEQIGASSERACTVSCTNLTPSVSSVTIANAESISAGWNVWVQNHSKATVTWTDSAQYSASIVSRKVQYYTSSGALGSAVTLSSGGTMGTVTAIGNVKVRVTVTDSRGLSAYADSGYVNVLAYSKPKIDNLTAYRCNQSGTKDDAGGYFRIEAGLAVSEVGSHNAKDYYIGYRVAGSTTWTEYAKITMTSYSGAIVSNAIQIDIANQYNVRIRLCDSYYNTESSATKSSVTIPTGSSFIDIYVDSSGAKKSIGIGRPATYNSSDGKRYLDIAYTPRRYSEDGISLGNITSCQTSYVTTSDGNWTSYKWDDGTMELTCLMTKNLAITSPWGNVYDCANQTIRFGGTFLENTIPLVLITNNSSYEAHFSVQNVTRAVFEYTAMRGTPATADFTFAIYARGRWK